MRKFNIFILLIIVCTTGYSQQKMVIEEIHVSNIQVCFKEGDIHDEREEGPNIGFTCCIVNTSDDSIKLNPKESDLVVEYMLNGKHYSKKGFSLVFQELDSLYISSKKQYVFKFSTRLLCSTDLLKTPPADYTMELLQVLPTLKVKYIEHQNKKRIESTEIRNVTIAY